MIYERAHCYLVRMLGFLMHTHTYNVSSLLFCFLLSILPLLLISLSLHITVCMIYVWGTKTCTEHALKDLSIQYYCNCCELFCTVKNVFNAEEISFEFLHKMPAGHTTQYWMCRQSSLLDKCVNIDESECSVP